MAKDYKRLLQSLNNSQFQKHDNALYQVVKSLITAAQDLSDKTDGLLLTINNIINTVVPADTVEDLDGTNDPGVSDEYSRGDHKHDYGVNSIDYNRIQQVSAADRLLGVGNGGPGNVEEIDLDPATLEIIGTTLTAIIPDTEDYVVMSNGDTPVPSPVDDGNGNFIYITYTP